jgi:ComF family protein
MELPLDGICPVPLHKNRLRKRGFNQSLLLAQELAEDLGIPVYPDGLRRIRDTLPQMELTREERLNNVKDAFAAGMEFHGRCILLVDDVLTTGASIRECARVVREGGGSVVCFCAARRE